MGNQVAVSKVNYEDIQHIIKSNKDVLLINTLDSASQACLIKNTINIMDEVKIINTYLKKPTVNIVIYGRNSTDETIHKKYSQLLNLGFTRVFVYLGGLFEWLCLQDIYGRELFPTTSKELDILKYKSKSLLTSINRPFVVN